MDKKLLMKVGIGAGVLVLGFLAYKKFVAKPKDTKSAEAETEEEEVVESEKPVSESVAPTKSQSVESPIVFTEWEGDGAEVREKFKKAFGITSEDWKKMREKSKDISMRQGRQRGGREAVQADIQKKLQKFASENNISYDAYLKASESYNEHKRKFGDGGNRKKPFGLKRAKEKILRKKIVSTPIASFMDFDGNDDVLGDIM